MRSVSARKAQKKRKVTPYIPIGTRGKLYGTTWEVIGFMQRCDNSEVYYWKEYLLYNPTKRFRWLMEFDGHWNFIKNVTQKPQRKRGNKVSYLKITFYAFTFHL